MLGLRCCNRRAGRYRSGQMSLLSLSNVSKTYGDKPLLRGVDFLVGEGDRIALVGRNGAGKSTLMRILAGIEEADDGERAVRRGLTIGMLDQEPALDATSTIREAVGEALAEHRRVSAALDAVHEEMATASDPDHLDKLMRRQGRLEEELEALGGHDVEHRVLATIDRLGLVDPDARCGNLSGGERRRVALAQLLLGSPDLLLLDEPTNHLDAEVIDWIEDWLMSSRVPLVLVTHDRYFLDRVVDRVVEVDRGQLHSYDGGYAGYLSGRAARLEHEARAESSRLNLLRRETEWMRRGPPARTTKAKGRIQRYEALAAGGVEAGPADLELNIPPGPRLGNVVVKLAGVGVTFGDRVVLDGVDLEIGPGECVGIVGPNGAGKSTLLKVSTGLLEPSAGNVTIGETVQFAAIDQNRAELDPEATVVEAVASNNDYVFVGARPRRIEGFLEEFLFKGAAKHSKCGDLSGGERARVLLARLLTAGGNVIVLDEPTNDLDLETLRALEEALVAFPGTVLVVSHDRWFLDRVATRIVACRGNGRHEVHESALSLVLERWAVERAEAEAAAAAARRAEAKRQAAHAAAQQAAEPKPRKLSSKEQRELEDLPAKIEAAETEAAECDEALADPDLYGVGGNPKRVAELTEQRDAAQARAAALYERWEELEAK